MDESIPDGCCEVKFISLEEAEKIYPNRKPDDENQIELVDQYETEYGTQVTVWRSWQPVGDFYALDPAIPHITLKRSHHFKKMKRKMDKLTKAVENLKKPWLRFAKKR